MDTGWLGVMQERLPINWIKRSLGNIQGFMQDQIIASHMFSWTRGC